MKDLGAQAIRKSLELKTYGVAMGFAPEVHDVLVSQPDQIADPLLHHWTIAFKSFFPSATLWKMRKPRTWWDAVKDRFVPVRLRRPPVVRDIETGAPEPTPWWYRFLFPIDYDIATLEQIISVSKDQIPRGMGPTFYYATFNGSPRSTEYADVQWERLLAKVRAKYPDEAGAHYFHMDCCIAKVLKPEEGP